VNTELQNELEELRETCGTLSEVRAGERNDIAAFLEELEYQIIILRKKLGIQ